MRCQCGKEFAKGKKLFNHHRRQCDAFWNGVKQEMERISMALRGKVTSVSHAEWDKHHSIDFPTKKSLIDWCGSWRNVQARVGLGMSKPGPRANAVDVSVHAPSLPQLIDKLREISRAMYGDAGVMGNQVYDDHRPPGWPTHRTILNAYGYSADAAGWQQFVADNSGLPVIHRQSARSISLRRREDEQAKAIAGFDYRTPPVDEKRLALECDGLSICAGTYQRTGRMVLR